MYYCEMGDEGGKCGDLNRGYTGVESTQVKQARGLGEKKSLVVCCARGEAIASNGGTERVNIRQERKV